MDAFNALGHIIIGLFLSIVVVDTEFGVVGVLLVVFGSLLPDIDHPKSKLGRYNYLNRTRFMKHRGKCHTVLGALLLSAPFLLVGPLAFGLVAYGAIGHILADKLYSWLPKKSKFNLKLW